MTTLYFDHTNGKAYEVTTGMSMVPTRSLSAEKLLSDLVYWLDVEFEYGVYDRDLDQAWKAARVYLMEQP
jgi:hypothetical protein